MRILVIEDDEAIGELVELALGDEGHEVTVAADGEQGLRAAHQRCPDLILLDMLMPVLDGWSFAARYRGSPGPHAPIVVMTAAADASQRAAEISAHGVLAKPFTLDELHRVVSPYDPSGRPDPSSVRRP